MTHCKKGGIGSNVLKEDSRRSKMSTVPARIAKGRGDGFGLSLPARNGVLFSKGHMPPSELRVNGYLAEGYKL
jgi:hypothetical protein